MILRSGALASFLTLLPPNSHCSVLSEGRTRVARDLLWKTTGEEHSVLDVLVLDTVGWDPGSFSALVI